MAVTARCFLGGQGFSAHFADFVPQEKKYVAFIAACPSQHDKLSRSNEEAISLSKEDVIEIEGIVREAMPNAIFKVEMLSEDTWKCHWSIMLTGVKRRNICITIVQIIKFIFVKI